MPSVIIFGCEINLSKKQKKNPVRIATRATKALKLVYDPSFKARANKLESIGEYSFGVLLYWNRIEALIKLLRYRKHITDEYPDKMNFINRSWNVLKNLYESDNEKYIKIFGDGRKTPECLWGVRDRIAHVSHVVKNEDYFEYKDAAIWVFDSLLTNMDGSFEVSQSRYLAEKKAKLNKKAKKK